ncbi:hypothetical protein [cf. Phormidesmis sp. LEGE 11477]|uniref:hypothetical protein n=1 Tax=cf. Phormidesmis sp. LEGE 11477 TaxID=1828680 RepID=UPI00187FD3D3|nr:hypothetical protein [cf. Phormidesmis sp. LEGE 11477]MBE9060939.1 hypothetical protein [cf. Phormidesmis sp. LEGE 11477]
MNYKRLILILGLTSLAAACSPTISSTAEENTRTPASTDKSTTTDDGEVPHEPTVKIPSESIEVQPAPIDNEQAVDETVGLVTTSIDSEPNAYETSPNDLLTTLGSDCDPRSIRYYRSQILSAPNSKVKAYATGLLTKTVSEERAERGREAGYCFGKVQDTANRQVVFQRANRADLTQKDDYEGGFVVFQPRSFSGGSSYLIGQSTVFYKGGESGIYVSIFDTATGEMDSYIKICQEEAKQGYGGSEYLGFSRPAEFVVSCYGERGEALETINLETGEVRRLSQRPASLTDYGTVESSFKAVRRDP